MEERERCYSFIFPRINSRSKISKYYNKITGTKSNRPVECGKYFTASKMNVESGPKIFLKCLISNGRKNTGIGSLFLMRLRLKPVIILRASLPKIRILTNCSIV
jgi:hypothetical protein